MGFQFDFDDWAALARRDPLAFERRREQVVAEVCEQLGGVSDPIVAGVCWRIEMERRRCHTPIQLCLNLSSLMWKRYGDMYDALNQPTLLTKPMRELNNKLHFLDQ